jgi:catechol 2,3-dioxygenase-like lactoylglutathione lyase family enzyme
MEEAVAVLRVANLDRALSWYQRLGFEKEWEYRFEPDFPAFSSISRGGVARVFLSEHTGDAPPQGLLCLRLSDLDTVANVFDARIFEQPWGREVHLQDPDGNHLRIGDLAVSPGN